MKEITRSAFHSGFLFVVSLWHLKGHGDLCTQDERFQFPLFIYVVFILKKNFWKKMAEILLMPTPSVTLLLRRSSMNSIDKKQGSCVWWLKGFRAAGLLQFFFFWSAICGRSERSRKVPGTKKLIMWGRQEQIGVTKTKIISHLQDIKCYTCSVCICFLWLLSNIVRHTRWCSSYKP